MIDTYKTQTTLHFNSLFGMTAEDIELYVLNRVKEELEDIPSLIIKEIALYGSRSRGLEHENSDIDLLLEYESEDMREDCLFNLLNDLKLNIGGIPIDINPIRVQETGTINDYLKYAEQYLQEKKGKNKKFMMIREFKDENGKVLCGADICEYHASVREAMKDISTSANFLYVLNRCFEAENIAAKRSISFAEAEDATNEMYDIHVAESHLFDENIQKFLNRYPARLIDSLGNEKLPEIAELYYALANGLNDHEIETMLVYGANHKNMREIRLGYEHGLGSAVLVYAGVPTASVQEVLRAGLQQGIKESCIEEIKRVNSFVTAAVLCSGARMGLNEKELHALAEFENAIIIEKNRWQDALSDYPAYDLYSDMTVLTTTCLKSGIESAENLQNAYIQKIRSSNGQDCNIMDCTSSKKNIRR